MKMEIRYKTCVIVTNMIVDNVKFTHRKVALSVQVDVSWVFSDC